MQFPFIPEFLYYDLLKWDSGIKHDEVLINFILTYNRNIKVYPSGNTAEGARDLGYSRALNHGFDFSSRHECT